MNVNGKHYRTIWLKEDDDEIISARRRTRPVRIIKDSPDHGLDSRHLHPVRDRHSPESRRPKHRRRRPLRPPRTTRRARTVVEGASISNADALSDEDLGPWCAVSDHRIFRHYQLISLVRAARGGMALSARNQPLVKGISVSTPTTALAAVKDGRGHAGRFFCAGRPFAGISCCARVNRT